ncbi:ABC transporter ATP-binding protein [Streptosporangiaceae bacterium NEAU-GS5]|nr:ABC transporter ATP-binding protein [Streptosporangiaceae bacterium NEAU-GS5]
MTAPPTTEPLVELRDVTVQYASTQQTVLDGVSLAVRPGELALVTGPSGCGKSTLLRVVNGLIPHSYRAGVTGEVLVGGKPAAGQTIRQISAVVGTLLQDPQRQIVGTTVRTEIAFGPENLALPRDEIRHRIDEVAGRVGITHLLDRATSQLSGGELQMVAFAGVLAMRPSLVVVDEPLANLDPSASLRLLRELRRFVDEGGAAIVVEHRVEEILEFAPSHVLLLAGGRPVYHGDVPGFLRVAPVGQVKLPFGTLVERAAELPEAPDRPARERGAVRLAYEKAALGYPGRTVLSGLDLGFGSTERVAVLGPNGAGKSTLLRAAMRLVEPSKGRVLVDGAPVAERSIISLATTFGYVFQNPGQSLFSGTVRDELAFGPRNLKWPKDEIEAASQEALRAVLLDQEPGILDRPPRTLSFGQQRRLTVALALAMRPKTLILDEPTAGQDLHTTSAFMDHVLDTTESVYFITHDVDLALTAADRIVVIDGGRVAADGSPAEIAHRTDLWDRLRETSLVRAVRAELPPKGALPHPFALARHLQSESSRSEISERTPPT